MSKVLSLTPEQSSSAPLLKAAAALSFLTGTPFRLHRPDRDTADLLRTLALGSGGTFSNSVAASHFFPGLFPTSETIVAQGVWSVGELMGVLALPMAAGIAPNELRFEGRTHARGRIGVSHLAEGILPMLDRRGTRSYVEIERWCASEEANGAASMAIRPPLEALLPENIMERGDVVEVRALIMGSPADEEILQESAQALEKSLEDVGLLFPEMEVQKDADCNGVRWAFIRAEYGNIRVLSEALMTEGKAQDLVEEVMGEILAYQESKTVLQQEIFVPLVLASLLTPGDSSHFFADDIEFAKELSTLIVAFHPNVDILLEGTRLEISVPNGETNTKGACETDAFWYPRRNPERK